MRLIFPNGHPDPNLLTLCRKYGIEAPDNVSPQELNDKLQQKWFKEGYLRFQIKGEPPNDEDRVLLRELDFIDEVRPPNSLHYAMGSKVEGYDPIHYAGVLLLGALRPRVVSRLHYLTTVTSNLKFKPDWKVYLLGSARTLDKEKEGPEVLYTPTPELPFRATWHPPVAYERYQRTGEWTGEEVEGFPTTEAEMMELSWQQSQLPDDWKYELVNTPLQPKPDGGTRPPNTGDTVKEWLTKHQPQPGYYLALSNQPFVEYQQLVLQRLVPDSFTVVACGPQSSLTLPLATYLDNAAKQVFEELQAVRQS